MNLDTVSKAPKVIPDAMNALQTQGNSPLQNPAMPSAWKVFLKTSAIPLYFGSVSESDCNLVLHTSIG